MPISVLLAERFLYLPLIGISIALAVAFGAIRQWPVQRLVGAGALLTAIVVCNGHDYIRRNDFTFFGNMTDGAGKNWSYLASTENYDRIRAMHQKNLVVPLVGDFAGPKAIRMAGQYVRDHADPR